MYKWGPVAHQILEGYVPHGAHVLVYTENTYTAEGVIIEHSGKYRARRFAWPDTERKFNTLEEAKAYVEAIYVLGDM